MWTGLNIIDFVWTCCGSFCQLWQEYMWSAVNVLKSCPKISDPTKRHDNQLNLFHINRTLAWKCCCADLSSVLELLAGWFWKGVPKQEFYIIHVISCFGMNNFGHIEDMKENLFSKFSKFFVDFENAIKLEENVDCF